MMVSLNRIYQEMSWGITALVTNHRILSVYRQIVDLYGFELNIKDQTGSLQYSNLLLHLSPCLKAFYAVVLVSLLC